MIEDTRHCPPPGADPAAGGRPPPFSIGRFWPLAVLAAGFAGFFLLGLDDYVGLDGLRQNHHALVRWVEAEGAMAVIAYILIYAAATAFSIPVGSLMTVTGGILFGAYAGTLYAAVSATCGATIVFLAAKTSLGDALRARAGPRLRRLEAGFQRNAFNYLLVLRLIPLFPFWLINLAPAFLGVGLRTFIAATALGIVPGSFVFALFGSGLAGALDAEGGLTLDGVLGPELVAALVGISLLALLPVVLKWWKGRPGAENQG